MKNILLVYSSGCPNYKPVKKMLLEIGQPFEEIVQDNLHKGCVCKTPSLPVITALNLLAYGLPRLCRWPGRYYDLLIDKALFLPP